MFRPETFAHTFGCSAARAERRRPFAHALGAKRGLAEVVDHDRQPGEALRELGQVAEVSREDAGKLEHEAALLHGREALEHAVLQDPVWVGLLVDQVADSPQRRLSARTSSRASAVARRARSTHAVTAAIQECSAACANIASVSLSVQADWTRIVRSIPHASSSGPQVRGLEIAGDRRVLGRHPRHRLPPEVPEMLMRVDRQASSFSGGGRWAPGACRATPGARRHQEVDDVLRRVSRTCAAFAFVTSAVPVSTFFGTALPFTAL